MRTRRTRRRPVSRRKREERRRAIRRRAMIAAGVLLLAGAAMTPQLRAYLMETLGRGMDAVQTLALPADAQGEITLPEKTVYALQLGAYDNGEHAQREMLRLTQEGTLCVIWQRTQMRLVCDAAASKGKLAADAARGHDAWVVQDTLPEVALRVSADASRLEAVRTLLALPDAVFAQLCAQEENVAQIAAQTRELAQQALGAHPENLLYTQLAQSLVNWCTLMENTLQTQGEEIACSYARVTMCTLCSELRQELLAGSAASTASAQRTPSTAADVMPPA